MYNIEERPFFDHLPDLYKDDPLLDRLTAVFEEPYLKLEKIIDRLPEMLYDPDQTPEPFLNFVGELVGLRNGYGQFSPEQMRELIPVACWLQGWKGTRTAMEKLLRIYLKNFCGDPVPFRIVEYENWNGDHSKEVLVRYSGLYGGEHDVTVLFLPEPALQSAEVQNRLIMLLKDYTPAAARLNAVFIETKMALDTSYLGYNVL
ncbi:hypothetical protein CAFE_00240 [Caprobacter fermentans]|uniref:Phage tail protein n=1 Tax=Caproicibacter fermentans TaxID=2576756 RepID=A0A6N8HUE1_9FIRM|nr:phage tail protein [Caproicibacter fermentans]MVB09376.1 hypothetical protein [Caproicibacter fermentans]